MKRVILISLFVIISARILQQLLSYPKLNQNLDSLNHNKQSLLVTNKIVRVNAKKACSSKNKSYNIGVTNHDLARTNRVFGSLVVWSDKIFFLIKELVFWLKDLYCSFKISIVVWQDNITSFKSLVVNDLKDNLYQLFSLNVSNIIIELLLGKNKNVETTNNHLFKVTGTQHLLAISGFHLSLFVGLVSKLYRDLFPKSAVIFVNILVCLLFIYVVGPSPGLFRAFLMFVFSSISWILNRQRRVYYIFFAVFVIAILVDIREFITIGFQLSYMATLGIILFSINFKPKFDFSEAILFGFPRVIGSIWHYFFDSILISFAVQIVIFPLVIYYFHQFSIVSIFATALVMWLIPLIFEFGYLLVILKFFLPMKFLLIFSLPLTFVVSLILLILRMLAFDWSLISIENFSLPNLYHYYIVIFLFYSLMTLIKLLSNRNKYEKKYHFFI